MAASPQEMKANMIAGLREKTGKSLEEWLAILRASPASKHKEFMTLLKTEYGVTHGFANMIALQALQSDSHTAEDTDALVDAQYAGAKATLRPIYDAVLAAATAFGDDVEASPKKAYVSLRRNKQFAIVQPSTSTRLDVGINLNGVESAGRLETSGSFNGMVSHRVRIASPDEVDDQLVGWLKQAYEAS
jgi:predicted transport protein